MFKLDMSPTTAIASRLKVAHSSLFMHRGSQIYQRRIHNSYNTDCSKYEKLKRAIYAPTHKFCSGATQSWGNIPPFFFYALFPEYALLIARWQTEHGKKIFQFLGPTMIVFIVTSHSELEHSWLLKLRFPKHLKY